MIKSWVFNTIKEQSLSIEDHSILNSTGDGYSSAINAVKWSGTPFSTYAETYPIFYIDFKYPIFVSKYKLSIKKAFRYMKNWVFEGSMHKSSYKILHTGANLCDSDFVNVQCSYDCGSNTVKEYSFTPGRYKYLRLRMTSKDSCSSLNMVLHGFDLYGTFIYSKPLTCLMKPKIINYLPLIILTLVS